MLLQVDLAGKNATRVRGKRLSSFGIDERALQDILFRSLDRLLPDDELILIMQSRHWREEPDLLALDKNGTLYIFELKAWESDHENLLQVLRYGQIFGPYKYDDLARLYEKTIGDTRSLKDAHKAKFELEVPLDEDKFNADQVFVVMTNGLDVKTREAIQYWHSRKLDVRPWIYRLYKAGSDDKKEMLLELVPFRVKDNPYEDVAEGYYILNTNYSNNPDDDKNMLEERKAAAYSDPWKYKIERLVRGDVVFLYRSGTGIVAVGEATGELKKGPHKGDPNPDDEYSMKLGHFQLVKPAVSAAKIKEVTAVNHRFLGTMFGIDAEAGRKLYKYVTGGLDAKAIS